MSDISKYYPAGIPKVIGNERRAAMFITSAVDTATQAVQRYLNTKTPVVIEHISAMNVGQDEEVVQFRVEGFCIVHELAVYHVYAVMIYQYSKYESPYYEPTVSLVSFTVNQVKNG